ncbi:hypothetical protein HY991_02695, partial [Candidatus Micrarchaeota archaeon]|nr:hypothetical protein [Candidatus Micrarchaeota archaeon]
MPIFGGGEERASKAEIEELKQALSTVLDRVKALESNVAVLTERYETFAKEQ